MIVNENGRTLYVTRAAQSRLKSCQIASNYEPVDAHARGKSFRLSPLWGKSANRNFLPSSRPLSPRKPPNTTLNHHRSLPSFPPLTYFPWKCKFRVTDIVSQTGDISHRRRGREVDVRVRKDRSYTVNIYLERIFPYPPRCNLDGDKVPIPR